MDKKEEELVSQPGNAINKINVSDEKENELLQNIEQLVSQPDNAISEINVSDDQPVKICKKKLSLYLICLVLGACLISAVSSFLLVDPFNWYTKSPLLSLLQKQKEEIKRLYQEFNELNLVSGLNSTNTIADLLSEIKSRPKINSIITSANELKNITSKKDNISKLSTAGEQITIEIIVKNGSLKREIYIELFISFEIRKLELQQEIEIERLRKQLTELNLVSNLNKTNTIADLLLEINVHTTINSIITTANEIKTITSKKDSKDKLSTTGEQITIKIIVKTGSLRKEIYIELSVIFISEKLDPIMELIKSSEFLDDIKNEIEADGIKRVSNLIAIIKTIIDKNPKYKLVFKEINFDIANDKNDDEIIASGSKTLKLSFNYIENNKLVSSSVDFNVNLQGKSRKEINKYLADNLPTYLFNFSRPSSESYSTNTFFAQTVFANKSTYQDLINELILFAPKNNFYLWADALAPLDNTDSKISIDFVVKGKSKEEFNEQIKIDDAEEWVQIELEVQFFVGNGETKSKSTKSVSFYINIMKENHSEKEILLYISQIREEIIQFFFKYKLNTKIGETYLQVSQEILNTDGLLKRMIKKEYVRKVNFNFMYDDDLQDFDEIISKDNLIDGKYVKYVFEFGWNLFSDTKLNFQWFPIYFLAEEKL